MERTDTGSLDQLVATHLVKTLPEFCETQSFITITATAAIYLYHMMAVVRTALYLYHSGEKKNVMPRLTLHDHCSLCSLHCGLQITVIMTMTFPTCSLPLNVVLNFMHSPPETGLPKAQTSQLEQGFYMLPR